MISFEEMLPIFQETKRSVEIFNSLLVPTIEEAANSHERLYFHHIHEEEEEHLKRLENILEAIHVLSDKNRERSSTHISTFQMISNMITEEFGLHNFQEHLDLALYEFKDDTDKVSMLNGLKEEVQENRNRIRKHMEHLESLMAQMESTLAYNESKSSARSLTIGSLKPNRSS
jgi:hypothetical protein